MTYDYNLFFIALSECKGPKGYAVRDCAKGYLFLGSPARLLRHTPRKRKHIITMPIIATPSFMPSQTESNESTVHHLSRGEGNG